MSEHLSNVVASEPDINYRPQLAGLDTIVGDPGPELMFDDRVYKRGALALHALRKRCGDLAFFALLHDWTDAHRHGSVSTAAFILAADRATGLDTGALLHPGSTRQPCRRCLCPDRPAGCRAEDERAAQRGAPDRRTGRLQARETATAARKLSGRPASSAARWRISGRERTSRVSGAVARPSPVIFSQASLRAQSLARSWSRLCPERPARAARALSRGQGYRTEPVKVHPYRIFQVHANRETGRRLHNGAQQDPARTPGQAQRQRHRLSPDRVAGPAVR